jgi:CRISPR-associated protein Cst2
MAHISGLLLIDCPASALNNAGDKIPLEKPDILNDNWTAIKKIRTGQGVFPYVSAQAFRYWLRDTLTSIPGWTPSPVFREAKVAYTDADPIQYAEDDVFGYMRAPAGAGAEIAAKRNVWKTAGLSDQDTKGSGKEEKFVALTRSSPFKMSTLISIGPLRSQYIGSDFGSMTRFEGDPVLFAHEFYRTTLVGMFSVDLHMLGRFYHVDRTGYRHLDNLRLQSAKERKLKSIDGEKAYELPLEDRKKRLTQLLLGLATLSGGAKQALHYTDVSPRFLLMGVAKGGNHLFLNAIGASKEGQPVINTEALKEVATVFKEDLLSDFFAGLAKGYMDDQRSALEGALREIEASREAGAPADRIESAGTGALASENKQELPSNVYHPVEAIRSFVKEVEDRGEEWLA